MQIRFTIDGREAATGSLADTPTGRDFAASLPLTLTLMDYAATEKISDLAKRPTIEGAPEGYTPKAGDIAFYAPWGNLAIFHKGFRYSPGLVRLGEVTAGLDKISTSGPISVTIERAD